MVDKTEGGLRNHRIEYVSETDAGTFPTDPAWSLFSDTVRSFEWAPDSNIEMQRGIGDVDITAFYKGSETHEITVTYDLQKKSTNQTFLTSGGAVNDAVTAAIQRDSDNLLQESHTVVDREDKGSINASQTWNGSTSYATRIYTVGKGGHVDSATINGDPGSQNPVAVELSYQFEKVRTYQIDQPGSSTELAIKSTDSNDTMDIKIEDEGAATTDTVTLSGTTLVSTTSTFSDVDAVQLTAAPTGTVEVYINDGTSSSPTQGDKLTEINGSNDYQNSAGDIGLPLLGSGSHATALGTDYEIIVGDTIERPSGTSLAFDINSVELSISNNIETNERVDDVSARIDIGGRDVELSSTVLGETESHGKIMEHLKVTENNVVWTFDSGEDIQVDSAALTDPGSRTIEAGDAAMTLDNTFTGKGLTINNSA